MAETVLGAIANARFKTGMFKAEKWILVVTDQRLLGARLSDEVVRGIVDQARAQAGAAGGRILRQAGRPTQGCVRDRATLLRHGPGGDTGRDAGQLGAVARISTSSRSPSRRRGARAPTTPRAMTPVSERFRRCWLEHGGVGRRAATSGGAAVIPPLPPSKPSPSFPALYLLIPILAPSLLLMVRLPWQRFLGGAGNGVPAPGLLALARRAMSRRSLARRATGLPG
jgi:hypothetical protein